MTIYKNMTNLDANQNVFFKRQLEYIESQTYDIKYPTLNATQVFPTSNEAGAGAESITCEQFDQYGLVKFVSDYADDLPRSDVKGKQFSIIVQSLGGCYGYSVQEVRAAAFANRPLTNMRAMAARQANDQMVNRIGWFADGTGTWAGVQGVLYHPNITKSQAPTGGWTGTTPANIIADFNFAVNTVTDVTNGVEAVDTVLIPNFEYSHIATTPRSDNTDTTILGFLQQAHPGVGIFPINELKDVSPIPRTGTGTANLLLAYSRNPKNLKYHLPVIFETFPAQERNLSFVVPVHSRNAGFHVYYPLSIHEVDGI